MQITRTGHRFPAKRFVTWRADALTQLQEQGIPRLGIDYPVTVRIIYWPSDKRRRDVPGLVDALWHLLEKYGVVKDDRWLGESGKELIFRNMGKLKCNATGQTHIEVEYE